ncbi:MAG: hypothetical protein ACE5JH_02505 [Acidobacteriota bacterium]
MRPPARLYPRRARRRVLALALSLLLFVPSCGRSGADPTVEGLRRALKRGERLILARVLDGGKPHGMAAVVNTARGGPEMRIYERAGRRNDLRLAYRSRQGGSFGNLLLLDVDADGREELVVTWAGGHLEILEVVARGDDGAYAPLFQEAGQRVEVRRDPAGKVEFWITGRTYEEGSGQPRTYATRVYAWDPRAEAVTERRR